MSGIILAPMVTDILTPDGQSYLIQTPIYEGPLDLLLQLIERAELDITRVALAEVTNPFLDYVKKLQAQQAEEVSSFLVMAARLMQIKSEALLPRPPERDPGEEDPGEALIQQLLLYKRFKEISILLRQHDQANRHTFLRLAPPPKIEQKLDMSEITLDDLVKAAEFVYELASKKPPLGSVVEAPKVTIREKIQQITTKLKKSGRSTFSKLLGNGSSRTDIVVTFLALLELVRNYQVQAYQDQLFGEIEIEPAESWDEDEDRDIGFID